MKTGDRVRLLESPFEPWDVSLNPGREGTVVGEKYGTHAVVDFEFDGYEPMAIPFKCLELA